MRVKKFLSGLLSVVMVCSSLAVGTVSANAAEVEVESSGAGVNDLFYNTVCKKLGIPYYSVVECSWNSGFEKLMKQNKVPAKKNWSTEFGTINYHHPYLDANVTAVTMVYGDIDGDGVISCYDAVLIADYASEGRKVRCNEDVPINNWVNGWDCMVAKCDVNRDGVVSLFDFNAIMSYLRHNGTYTNTSNVGSEACCEVLKYRKGSVSATIKYFRPYSKLRNDECRYLNHETSPYNEKTRKSDTRAVSKWIEAIDECDYSGYRFMNWYRSQDVFMNTYTYPR